MPPRYRVCADCPNWTDGHTRCADCRSANERARGTRQQRGYNKAHDELRALWKPKVKAGGVACWRCGLPITTDQPWDLGHDDTDRCKHRGPEHQACNRATATRR